MPGFFGDPYVARYTGPTAHEAISDVLAGQQQGFNQNEDTKKDAANGIFLQDKDFGAFHDAQMQGDLGQMSDAMSANATGMGTDIARGIQGGAPDQGAGLMRLRAGGNGSATPAGMPASGAPGTTQGAESAAFGGGTVVPEGHPAAAPQSPLGRRPIAGELMPAQGRFATTVDGQQHDQATAALASGLPPAGLMATHAGQGAQGTQGPSVGVAAQMAGHPGAYHMPTVNTTARRPSPPAAAPQPAPAAAPPEAAPLPAAAPQDPQLVNAQAQAAMISPDQASQMAPSVPQFLSRQGIPSSLALPSGGGVSYAIPQLSNAYRATAAANLAAAEQNAQTGRTALDITGRHQDVATEQTGSNLRSANEIAGRHQDVGTEQAGALTREQIEAAARERQYELEGKRLDVALQQQTNTNNMHAGTEFMNAIKPADAAMDQYRNFAAAIDQLRGTSGKGKPNPDALRAAGTAFAALTEGSPRISRFILAQAGKGPDLSWLGGGANAIAKGLTGSFTPETLSSMERAARAVAQEKIDTYNQQRQGIGKFLPPSAQGLLPSASQHYADVIDRMAPKESDYDRSPTGYQQFQRDKAQWQTKTQ